MHGFNNIDFDQSQSGYSIANLHPWDYEHFVHKPMSKHQGDWG